MGLEIGAYLLTKVGYSGHAVQPAACTMKLSVVASPVERVDLEVARAMESGAGDGDI